MKLTKQEQDIVRRKFSKYCIEVLNGEALNYLEELDRLWEQEINFSDLGESILNQFCSYDEIPESDYFQIMVDRESLQRLVKSLAVIPLKMLRVRILYFRSLEESVTALLFFFV